jgi:hypothetical protein
VAKPRPEKRQRTPLPELRVLPMELRVGDRLTDETGEWEVIGRPFTTAAGKTAHIRLRKISDPPLSAYGNVGSTRTATREAGECRRRQAMICSAPWHATQRAAWEAVKYIEAAQHG